VLYATAPGTHRGVGLVAAFEVRRFHDEKHLPLGKLFRELFEPAVRSARPGERASNQPIKCPEGAARNETQGAHDGGPGSGAQDTAYGGAFTRGFPRVRFGNAEATFVEVVFVKHDAAVPARRTTRLDFANRRTGLVDVVKETVGDVFHDDVRSKAGADAANIVIARAESRRTVQARARHSRKHSA